MISEETRRFIEENRDREPEELALMGKRFPDLPMAFVAQQVKGRRKIRHKLPSWYENPRILYPKSLPLEQCSSEQVARFRSGLVGGGEVALDLTGGFGVDARFLAERFGRYRYCERDAELAEIAGENFKAFGLGDRIEIETTNGTEVLNGLSDPVDLIYVDPARRDGRSLKVSAFEDCEPDVVAIWERLLKCGKEVMVKASPGLDISSGLSDLPSASDVYVISVESECKELLFRARAGFREGPRIHCVNIRKSGDVDELAFSLQTEKSLEVECGGPGRFIYEPNASIMKAGAFKSVAARWGIRPLNPRTRLYGSDELVEDFQGRVFEVIDQGALAEKDAKRMFPEKRANVISRNSGMSAVELRQKLGLKDGGELFAIGAAVSGEGRRLYACRLARD